MGLLRGRRARPDERREPLPMSELLEATLRSPLERERVEDRDPDDPEPPPAR